MSRGIGAARDRILNALLGVDLRANIRLLQSLPATVEDRAGRQQQEQRDAERAEQLRQIQETMLLRLGEMEGVLRDHGMVMRAVRDDIGSLRLHLAAIRSSVEYAEVLADRRPLVTVRIASYQNTEALITRAIASVQRQTYDHFEIVVVNDGPNERTRSAIEDLNDPRIRYVEFSEMSVYPTDDHHRWMVAGSPGMNAGAAMARGRWIAPLDDDDEFAPDHLEKLLSLAWDEQVEVAYGAVTQVNVVNDTRSRIYSVPPRISQFSFQGAIYMAQLDGGFRYDEQSWIVEEPGDWNLIRRMSAAGVRMAGTPDVVATMFQVPYTHKDVE